MRVRLDRLPTCTNVIDVLDHVLDKGVVMDAWIRLSHMGIDLVTIEARVVVASIETYLHCASAMANLVSRVQRSCT